MYQFMSLESVPIYAMLANLSQFVKHIDRERNIQPIEAFVTCRTLERSSLAMAIRMTSQMLNAAKNSMALRALKARILSSSSLPVTSRA